MSEREEQFEMVEDAKRGVMPPSPRRQRRVYVANHAHKVGIDERLPPLAYGSPTSYQKDRFQAGQRAAVPHGMSPNEKRYWDEIEKRMTDTRRVEIWE